MINNTYTSLIHSGLLRSEGVFQPVYDPVQALVVEVGVLCFGHLCKQLLFLNCQAQSNLDAQLMRAFFFTEVRVPLQRKDDSKFTTFQRDVTLFLSEQHKWVDEVLVGLMSLALLNPGPQVGQNDSRVAVKKGEVVALVVLLPWVNLVELVLEDRKLLKKNIGRPAGLFVKLCQAS